MPKMEHHPLAALFGQQEPQPDPVFPVKEAQREMLAQVCAPKDRRPFERGDPVHYSGPVSPLRRDVKAQLVFVFYRYLEESSVEDDFRTQQAEEIELKALPFFDCLLANYDGQIVKFYLGCTALLTAGDAPDAT